uniref:Uncharacterized protein n=1 Tax=Globodera rostochiensis TaxID=31243 RepID=A0A914GTB1_GLORO
MLCRAKVVVKMEKYQKQQQQNFRAKMGHRLASVTSSVAPRQIIYTKNGERLDTANLFVSFVDDLFPCVSLFGHRGKVEASSAGLTLNLKTDSDEEEAPGQ